MFLRSGLLVLASAVAISTTPASAGIAFLALGDWGGWSDQLPTSTWQITTAEGMNRVAQRIHAESVLLLGDNFYSSGVSNQWSNRFQSTFETVYGPKEYLAHIPYHVIAGNHDHRLSVQAQLDYHSERWQFPALNYVVRKSWRRQDGGTGTVDIIFIDTVQLCTASLDDRGHHLCDGCRSSNDRIALGEAKWQWLEAQIRGSTADFLLVAGHHPIYSVGDHGPTPELIQRLRPLLKAHGGHYLSGHDHQLEHFEEEGVHSFVSGAGRMCCYQDPQRWNVPQEAIRFYISGDKASGAGAGPRLHNGDVVGGFLSVELFDDFAKFAFWRENGDLLYEPPAVPKRQVGRRLDDIVL
mmetsp:Transcript_42729/g.91663  ORF Transcript_42729/g.91663 Transcript_42729/m.91663 type:complete len:353 (+) Transcript_42729:218-1276(+)|eukprot:CAMPEP_0206431228 /NCGR_PEP_ID=MMETSP0324_2-20121206/7248_1 /ASSEMBLY_ACC=CAM_ASM_000836 /TAXON_ID=2866 /ORGANISM="Crypthecodinium cohnii, Strain Seligo" /LENGTH=352 /DNA_ID=CAMNT_0053897133 /DNA_START=143 /DNA_END=1201 /DNA_ORIENTATION=-